MICFVLFSSLASGVWCTAVCLEIYVRCLKRQKVGLNGIAADIVLSPSDSYNCSVPLSPLQRRFISSVRWSSNRHTIRYLRLKKQQATCLKAAATSRFGLSGRRTGRPRLGFASRAPTSKWMGRSRISPTMLRYIRMKHFPSLSPSHCSEASLVLIV